MTLLPTRSWAGEPSDPEQAEVLTPPPTAAPPPPAAQVSSASELPPHHKSTPQVTKRNGEPRKHPGVGRIVGGSFMVAVGTPFSILGLIATAEFGSAPVIGITIFSLGVTFGGIALIANGSNARQRARYAAHARRPQLAPVVGLDRHGGVGGFALRF